MRTGLKMVGTETASVLLCIPAIKPDARSRSRRRPRSSCRGRSRLRDRRRCERPGHALRTAASSSYGQTDSSPGLDHRNVFALAQCEQCAKDRRLQRVIARLPERVTQRVRHGEHARRSNTRGDFGEHRDRRRRDSSSLELGLNQTHGLVAERSNRYEQGDVDLVVDEQLRCRGCTVANQSTGRRDRAHERQVSWRDRTDRALERELA